MNPAEKLHVHHEKLIGTIRDLAERTKFDAAEASLLIEFCEEYLISHAEAEEDTLYKADTDTDFVENMIREHREITNAIEALGSAYARGDSTGLVSETNRFMALLNGHFDEEENTLMPHLSERLTQQELESIIEEAHRIEAEKKTSDLRALFGQDHKRIDFNIARLRSDSTNPKDAELLYSKVRAQLLKHIELEETVLFPAFGENARPGQTGPVQVMIAEHQEITSILSTMGDSLGGEGLQENIEAMISRLAVHNKKEELILYPMINRALAASGRVKIFKECYEGFASV